MAVSRDAGHVLDDCSLLAQETIEERALANIRSTDNDDALAGVGHIHLVQANERAEQYRCGVLNTTRRMRRLFS